MSTGRLSKPALIVKLAKWQMHPTSKTCGFCLFINFYTPDLAPFMTFVVSDINAMELVKSNPFLANDDYKASKRFEAVPMFTIGISRNRV